jgi:RES domain-containing protein
MPYVDIALDGIGGMYTSGRWHNKGYPIVYIASSAALAALLKCLSMSIRSRLRPI